MAAEVATTGAIIAAGALVQHNATPFAHLFRNILFSTLEVTDPDYVRDVDAFVVNNCLTRSFGVKTPGNGYHWYPCWSDIHGLLLFYRYSNFGQNGDVPMYTISALSNFHIRYIRRIIFQTPRLQSMDVASTEIQLSKIESIADHQHEIYRKIVTIPKEPYKYQMRLLDDIFQRFEPSGFVIPQVGKKKTLVVLICGPSGCGKSVMARFLLRRLQEQLRAQHQQQARVREKEREFATQRPSTGSPPGSPPGPPQTPGGAPTGPPQAPNDPLLIEGFDPSKPGLNLTKHVLSRREAPGDTILLPLEEIDIAMAKSANTEPGFSQFMDHARNKTSICKFFDDLSETPNLITLCSSNLAVEEFEAAYPTYVRDGRFDIRVNFTGSPK